MSLNREKHSNFFPSKVYRCPCLMAIVNDCYENVLNSFVEIHDEVWNFVLNGGDIGKVFAVKCGENTCNGETYCKGCIKHYLRKSFTYFYFKEF